MADAEQTPNTPNLTLQPLMNPSTESFMDSTTMTDTAAPTTTTEQTPPTKNEFYTTAVEQIFMENKLLDAQNALKQISKILSGIAKSPYDKKKRQQPSQGIIVKKFVYGIKGGIELMKILGFEETTVEKKPYIELVDSSMLLTPENQLEKVALDLMTISSSNPIADKVMKDEIPAPSTPTKKIAEEPEVRQQCLTGCGFFGSRAQDGLCSSCYKAKQKASGKPIPSSLAGSQLARMAAKINMQTKCVSLGCPFARWKGHNETDPIDFSLPLSKQPRELLLPSPKEQSSTSVTPAPTEELNISSSLLTPKPLHINASTDPNPFSLAAQKPTLTKYCAFCHVMNDYTGHITNATNDAEKAQNAMNNPPIPPTSPTDTMNDGDDSVPHIASTDEDKLLKNTITPPTQDKQTRFKMNLNAKLKSYYYFKRVMRDVQFNKERCWECRRKIGITGTECPGCNFVFCGHHRYPASHNCSYDHAQRYAEVLAKSTLTDISRGKLDGDNE